MAAFGPSAAAGIVIASFDLVTPPIPASTVLADICMSEGWFVNQSQAEEQSEKWLAQFLSRLRSHLSAANEFGRGSRFAFNSSSDDLLQGACYAEPSDLPEVREAKLRRANYATHQGWMRNLTPQQFEATCRGVLVEMGATSTHLTPRSGDQGIDFFGRLSFYGRLAQIYSLPGIDRRLSVWLVGQAKHYPTTRVATPDIRELVGSIELAKTKTFVGHVGSLEELEIAPCDPIFYLFFTTGLISRDGWTLLRRSGVIGMDGEMVATFLADSGVGLIEGKYDAIALNDWLATHASTA
jgi:hypothetical protein